MLPTNHGFDESYGSLYHLNADEEPELPDYPKNPEFRKKYGPHGVIHSFADGKIEDTGPLPKKRMETIDDDIQVRSQISSSGKSKRVNPSSSGSITPTCTSAPTPSQRVLVRLVRTPELLSRYDDRSRQERGRHS